MKQLSILLALSVIIFVQACSDNKNSEKIEDTKKRETISPDTLKKDNFIKQENKNTDTTTVKTKKTKKIYKYICPLSCKNGKSDTFENCPRCGMEMIENPDYKTNTDKNE